MNSNGNETQSNIKNHYNNRRINGSELVATNTTKTNNNNKTIKWIKVKSAPSSKSKENNTKIIWKPVYILRSIAPNRTDCEYFIGVTTDNKHKQYHINQLYDEPDLSKCSKKQLLNTMMKSLDTLFSQITVCSLYDTL